MKTKQAVHLTLIITFISSLLALSWLAAPSRQLALADGAGTTVTGEKILVSLSNDTLTWADDTLYALNPADGTGQTKIFDFHSSPKFTTGAIGAPRISADGGYIYFHSEHADIYTPARSNAFRVASDGSGLDQITPGENSGVWGETGNSTVSGQVQYGDGTGWPNAPVYLEGMDMVYSGADGSFSFSNVPPGARWLVAYNPGDTTRFDSTPITVVSGFNNTGLTLAPSGTYRMNFRYPVLYGSRVYYNFDGNSIQWTDLAFSAQQTVYTTPADACTGIPMVDAFDVGTVTGKIAVYDYQEGCGIGNNNHNGIYIVDKDGGGKQLLDDLLNATGWSEPLVAEIFWSPDESRIAFKSIYNSYNVLVVVDANTGTVLGIAAGTTGRQLTLHGWNPAGDWLLYSYYDGTPTQSTLAKIKVNTDGSIDLTSDTALLSNQPISGATWGTLSAPGGGTATPTATTVAPTATTVAPTATTVAPTATTVAPTATTVAPTATTVAPTATATSIPSASISLNYTTGQPGSSFIATGQNFSNGNATVTVNGTAVGTVAASGNFTFTLVTDAGAAEGPYIVTADNGTSSASTAYSLSNSAPLHSSTAGSSITVPASVGPGSRVYLPLVLKN